MAEPPDQRPAAGRGHLRTSHADREQVIEILKTSFVQGRLTKDELDLRAGQALASRTYAELAALTADLPAAPAVAQPRTAAQAESWLTMKRAVTCSACMLIPTAMVTVIGWAAAGRPDASLVSLLSLLAFFVATVVAGTMIGEAWDKNKLRRGQLPPRSAQAGQALAGKQSGGPGDDLILCEARSGTPRPSPAWV